MLRGMHESVEHATRAYLRLVDDAVPRRIEGLYLVGSVALGDFHPGRSDIDFIAVVSDTLLSRDLDALARIHTRLRDQVWRPDLSGVYVTWEDLHRDPRHVRALAHHHRGRFACSGDFAATPVQWLTLTTNPVAARGPQSPAVWTDPGAVHSWTLEKLNSYWASWVASQRRVVGSRAEAFGDRGICRGVLGVSRLHFTLSTGGVTSKTGAGDYALSTFAATWHPIVNEALRIRRGHLAPRDYRHRPLLRRRQALEFMAHVIDDANLRYRP